MPTPCSRSATRTSTAWSLRSSGTVSRRDSGDGTGSSPTSRPAMSAAAVEVVAVGQVQREGAAADRRLELVGGALRDLDATVDHRDPVGELVGLVEVLRRQQHGAALGDQLADGVPHLAAGARVEAGGRLVEEDQRRPGDQAGGEVEPAPHASGEGVIGLEAASVRSNCSSSRCRRAAASTRLEPLEAAEEEEVLGGGEVLVDRGVLPGDAEQLAHDVGLPAHVVRRRPRPCRRRSAAGWRAS